MDNNLTLRPKGQEKHDEIVIYQSEDGQVKVDVLFENETVWLTIDQMSVLFGKSRSTINEHILNIYAEGELVEDKSRRKSEFPNILLRQPSLLLVRQRYESG